MDNGSFIRKRLFFVLSGIALLGLFLRAYELDFQSLWYDELHSIIPTNPENSLASIIEYSKGDQPPAYFIMLHYFFKIFGYSEIVGRSFSVLLGLLGIPAMYLLGREIKGVAVGVAAALITSLNYMHIYYSQELRFYSLVFLLTSLSFLFFIRAFKFGRRIDFILYVLFTTALLYSQYYGLVIFAVQAIAFLVLLVHKRDGAFVLNSIVAGTAVLVLFIPWLPVILSDLKIDTFWIRRPSPGFIAEYFYYYFGKDALVTAIFILFIGLFLKALGSKGAVDAKTKPLYYVLICWLLFSYLIPYLKSVNGTPILYVRYTIVSLPAWILIISIGWDMVRNLRWKLWFGVCAGISMIINLIFIRQHYDRIEKQQFREATSVVKFRNLKVPVYTRYPWHFNFYFKDHPLKAEHLDLVNLSDVDTFWVLQVDFFNPDEGAAMVNTLKDQFEVVESHSFHKTDALLLKRTNREFQVN